MKALDRAALLERDAIEIQRGACGVRYFYTQTDDLGRRAFTDYYPDERRGQAYFTRPELVLFITNPDALDLEEYRDSQREARFGYGA